MKKLRFGRQSVFKSDPRAKKSLNGANLGAQKAPKWSPRGGQDGAKKEKKNEVKKVRLREVKK